MTAPQGIIWDLDGTLYRYSPACQDIFARATVHAALHCGVPCLSEDIFRQAWALSSTHTLVEAWQRNYSIDKNKFHDAFFDHPDVVAVALPQPDIAESLEGIAQDSHAILTHASKRWAKRMLVHLGLSRFFREDLIFGLENVGFDYKHDSTEPFEQVARALGLSPERIVMVEDSPGNLLYAHKLGMATALIHHGRPLDPLPSHVHVQHETAADFIASLVPPQCGKGAFRMRASGRRGLCHR